jgi:Protein of unknown function (DUF2793)
MAVTETSRHKLPLLAISQAQKEITHNEALVRIDALLHPVVEAELSTPPVSTEADIGTSWLVGASPSSEWAGKSGQLAIWVDGGWRFCGAFDGMRIRSQSDGLDRVYGDGIWHLAPTIPDPENGAVVDVEARAALIALLEHLRGLRQVSG